jgi:ABC-type polysaccharide/polyol phosphate export permease
MIWWQFPSFIGWLIYGIASFVILWIGVCWFQKARKGFADVI